MRTGRKLQDVNEMSTTKNIKLRYIENARRAELGNIEVARHRLAELNTQRQNIIMSEDEGDVEN